MDADPDPSQPPPDARAPGPASTGSVPVSIGSPPALGLADWLTLREDADAVARAPELLEPLRRHLAAGPAVAELFIRDLGAGTGSMLRWLAPQLPGAQRWILHEHDPGLLALAGSHSPGAAPHDSAGKAAAGFNTPGFNTPGLRAADGSSVTVVPLPGDITELRAADLVGTALVTGSALLDLLTWGEVDQLAAACVTASCPALLALSVDGDVTLTPADFLDAEITDAFNAHQRRTTGGRQLLGPDAAAAAAAAFTSRGSRVLTQPSPWRLDARQAALTTEWLHGWVAAAVQWRPDLTGRADAYLRRRLDACAAGDLRVAVLHTDLLALPAPGRSLGRVVNQQE